MEEFVVMLEAKLENDEMSFEGAVNKTGSLTTQSPAAHY